MLLKHILNKDEFEQALKENFGVLFYFSRKTCKVGEALEPKIINLLESNYPKISFYFVDIDLNSNLSLKYSLLVEPTVLVFFDKKEVIRKNRVFSIDELSMAIDRIPVVHLENTYF